ncbi:hypothetical protein EW026_g3882 [Hermanssonia centrifuga]|uniref:NADP-dependent oxidoreductase domain-containing protein n=1 Tax=Hermanssonia centrifuga TaxID=98765 RepID=A0A4S4KNG9_9APHY|nr:hypothetical protein EW026_g3882 [Hermanssonia centrifuga]
MPALSLATTRLLTSGHNIPILGFGVAYGFGKSEDPAELTKPCVLEAFKVGYSVLAAVDASLKATKFDYLDLYLIHSPPSGTSRRIEAWRALVDAKKQGKIRSIGVSNYNVKHIEEIKKAGYELPSINQVELHPFCQQSPIVEYCHANNIVVEAYCPILRGKMDDPIIVDIAQKLNKEPAQVLLRWSLQRGFVPLVRSSNPTRIKSNAAVFDFELDEDDVNRLNGLDQDAEGAISWNPVDVE